MKKTDYSRIELNNKEELFDRMTFRDPLDSEQESLDVIRESALYPLNLEVASSDLIAERERERDLFQMELENMLEEYDLEKMILFNQSLENMHSFNKTSQSKNGEMWELIYWYVFHDQPGYRPELIRTPIEVLKTKGYI